MVRSMGFGRVLSLWRSAETVYWHLHPAKKAISGFLCLLIVFLKSKTHQLNLKDMIKLNKNLLYTKHPRLGFIQLPHQ